MQETDLSETETLSFARKYKEVLSNKKLVQGSDFDSFLFSRNFHICSVIYMKMQHSVDI